MRSAIGDKASRPGEVMSLESWKQAGKTFSYRGHPIFYRDGGGGEPLLCVHGFPSASWDWQRVWQPLSARYRLIAADMIGFGFSAKPRAYGYSIFDQATLHETLLAELGVERIHVLAHDYGDTVTQELLARFEERGRRGETRIEIGSVCFLNGGLFPERHRARLVQRLLMTRLGPLLSRLGHERSFRRSFAAIFGPETQPSPAELSEYWQLVAHNEGQRIMHELIGYIEERRAQRSRWVGALQSTEVPLRFINGIEDPVSGKHMAARYRELVPNPDVVLLDGIGHYPQVEAPASVVREYLAFRG